jgi:hypothetical protein
MELASDHLSGAYNFDVTPRSLKILWTSTFLLYILLPSTLVFGVTDF